MAVDDRTRLAYVEALADQQGQTAAGFMTRALAWFAELGVQVERVLTDNGWCYRSAAFQHVLAEAGAAHRRTRPYRPQTNGKAERFNRTLATDGVARTSMMGVMKRQVNDVYDHRGIGSHRAQRSSSTTPGLHDTLTGTRGGRR